MLFKMTAKAASAAALWMVALLGANSAMAQDMLPTYSAEALMETRGAMAFSVNSATALTAPLAVTDDGVKFDLHGAAAGSLLYLRVAPSGMAFATANLPTLALQIKATATDNFADAGTTTVVTGGATGGAMLFSFDAGGTNIRGANAVQFLATIAADGTNPEAMVSAVGTAGLTISLYKTEREAYLGTGTPLQSGTTNFFHVASSVTAGSATAAAVDRTASAAAQFRQFIEDDRNAGKTSLGGFDVKVSNMHRKADGTMLGFIDDDSDANTPDVFDLTTAYADVGINTMMSSSKFYGADDQGFAYASAFELKSMPDCSGDGPGGAGTTGISSYPGMMVDEGEDPPDPNEVVGGIAPEAWYLCVTVAADNTEAIPRGDVMMDLTIGDGTAADMMRLVSPAAASVTGVTVATIGHDGTTVQIPYLTSYEPYTQRIVIINRAKNDVDFTLTFRLEGDGMIAASDSAHSQLTASDDEMSYSGTAMGDATTVIKVADEVTLTGPTRASASLVLTGAPGSIDVATTLINESDGSTDTVVLH